MRGKVLNNNPLASLLLSARLMSSSAVVNSLEVDDRSPSWFSPYDDRTTRPKILFQALPAVSSLPRQKRVFKACKHC